MAIPNAKRILADSIEFATEAKSALKGADCCILMTEREEFGKLTEERLPLPHASTESLVDARRIHDPTSFKDSSFAAHRTRTVQLAAPRGRRPTHPQRAW